MGHSIGISGSYYRATENELLEDYLKAIDALTIDNDNMLERQFNKLEEKGPNLKIFEKSRKIELLYKNDISKDDAIAAVRCNRCGHIQHTKSSKQARVKNDYSK